VNWQRFRRGPHNRPVRQTLRKSSKLGSRRAPDKQTLADVHTEAWNEHLRLLRALLVLLATLAGAVGYASLQRLAAVNTMGLVVEEMVTEAVESTMLVSPTTFSVTVSGRPLVRITLAPLPDREPVRLAEAVQAALSQLQGAGFTVEDSRGVALKSRLTGIDLIAAVEPLPSMPEVQAKLASEGRRSLWVWPAYQSAVEPFSIRRAKEETEKFFASTSNEAAPYREDLDAERISAIREKCPLRWLPVVATYEGLAPESLSLRLQMGPETLWRWSSFSRPPTDTEPRRDGVLPPLYTGDLVVLSTRVARVPDMRFVGEHATALTCEREYAMESALAWQSRPKAKDTFFLQRSTYLTYPDSKPAVDEARSLLSGGFLGTGGDLRISWIDTLLVFPLLALILSIAVSHQLRSLASLDPALIGRALYAGANVRESRKLSPLDGRFIRAIEGAARAGLITVILAAPPFVAVGAFFSFLSPINPAGALSHWDIMTTMLGNNRYVAAALLLSLIALSVHQLWIVFGRQACADQIRT